MTDIHSRFKPDLTPDQMDAMGVLRHPGSQYGEGTDKDNFFGVSASMKAWPGQWHNEEHPQGWYQWYKGYAAGKRTEDDERQIKRWLSFKARHLAQLQKADPTLSNLSIQPKRRQALLNWGIAPGIDLQNLEKKASFNRYLLKIARSTAQSQPSKTEAEKPHVVAALNKLERTNGVIINWSTGAGKTRAFLLAAQRAQERDKQKRALIVAPASLVTNVDKEIKKHKIRLDRNRLDVMSYEKATRDADQLSKNEYSIAIADEGHKFRNPSTKRTKSLADIFSASDQRLIATATSNYNHNADIASLINITAGNKILPEDRKEFEKHFVGVEKLPRGVVDTILNRPAQERQVLKKKQILAKIFKDHVHYYDNKEDPAAVKKFPKVTEKTVEVEMSPDQHRMYKYVEGQMPFWMRMKIRYNLPMDKQEKASLNSFSSGVRQVSNSYRPYHQDPDAVKYTPKIEKAVGSLKKRMAEDKNFKGLVYSNYLGAGLEEYSRKLKEEGISHSVFTGALTRQEKDKIVEAYNSGKCPVILVSSSGAEGLDLKGTKLTQVLEPHFNPSKIRQIVGRGARYESHEHLPEEERNMEVEHYLSISPKGMLNSKGPTSIDQYLSGMSDDKAEMFNQIKQVMKENS